jgi:CsoR family transcriptional regulator, copper-sensing transcriptional repressor
LAKPNNPSHNGPDAARQKARPRPAALERDLAIRVNRAEGQLRGLGRMIANGAYCIDVLQQISAARRALDKIALILVRDHLETCVADAIAERGGRAKINELVDTLDRFLN